jgi:hypothetical protein
MCLILAAASGTVAIKSHGNPGQTKADFDGTWKLDLKKSNATDIGKRDATIKILYHEPELKITRTFVTAGQAIERDFVYYTDGRGEINPATIFLVGDPRRTKLEDIQNEQLKSKTKGQRDKIVIRASTETRMGGMRLQYLVVEEWKLSEDGKILTQTSRFQPDPNTSPMFTPVPDSDQKRVYVLISK